MLRRLRSSSSETSSNEVGGSTAAHLSRGSRGAKPGVARGRLACLAASPDRDREERQQHARGEHADAPPDTAQVVVTAGGAVQRDAPPARRGQRNGGRCDQQVELVAARAVEEALLP